MAKQEERSGCLAAIISLFGVRLPGPAAVERLPYRRSASLLSPAERSFFGVLQKAVEGRATLMTKVRVGDVLYVPRGKGMRTHQNRINSKHVDFVICTSDTLRPLAAIELDDASHQRPDRVNRDGFLDDAFESARLPLLRFAARRHYDPSEIAAQVEPLLTQSEPSSRDSAVEGSTPLCPACDSPMVLRTATSGRNKGSSFYGCCNYPQCREIIAIQ